MAILKSRLFLKIMVWCMAKAAVAGGRLAK
jgi:hypothetical protein